MPKFKHAKAIKILFISCLSNLLDGHVIFKDSSDMVSETEARNSFSDGMKLFCMLPNECNVLQAGRQWS